MVGFIRKELAEFGRSLRAMGVKPVVILVAFTLFQTMFFYFQRSPAVRCTVDNFAKQYSGFVRFALIWQNFYHVLAVVPYFVLPALVIRLGFREKLRDYGVCRGDWRLGLKYFALLFSALMLLLIAVSFFPDFRHYYDAFQSQGMTTPGRYILLMLYLGIHLFAWEFACRGFLVLGLYPSMGWIAVAVSAVPFCILHYIGNNPKPLYESLGALFAGIVQGYITIRCKSLMPTWLLHWITNMVFFILILAQTGHLSRFLGL